MFNFLKPAPYKPELPPDQIDPTYKRLRWQVFMGIFFGYAAYYLVRKNFALAMPYLIDQGFSRGDLGFALFKDSGAPAAVSLLVLAEKSVR